MIYLKRTDFLQNGIFGTLENDDKTLFFATAEHSFEVKTDPMSESTVYQPAMDPGQYTCVLGEHTLIHHPVPFKAYQIYDVPRHSQILLHIGNFPQTDSEGCVLLGMARLEDMVTLSEKAFEAFMAAMNGVDKFQLLVS
jgi:hypothetical protein